MSNKLPTINKTDFIELLAESMEISKVQASNTVDSFLDLIIKQLGSGKNIVLTGYLNFTSVLKEARTGRNPKTGEQIKIPAKHAIKIKPGKKLVDDVTVLLTKKKK